MCLTSRSRVSRLVPLSLGRTICFQLRSKTAFLQGLNPHFRSELETYGPTQACVKFLCCETTTLCQGCILLPWLTRLYFEPMFLSMCGLPFRLQMTCFKGISTKFFKNCPILNAHVYVDIFFYSKCSLCCME